MKDDDPRDKTAHKGPRESGAEEDASSGTRREPVFSAFEEEDDFEEAERDTDLASVYEDEEDGAEDAAYPDTDEEDLEDDWQPVTRSHEWSESQGRKASGNPWDAVADVSENGDDSAEDEPLQPVPRRATATAAPEENSAVDAREDIEYEQEYDQEDDWDEDYDDPYDELEDEGVEDDGYAEEVADTSPGWPLGLIVVALVALGLLAAGGYGVIQQRAATQDEIRQLQSALATAASPAEVAESREALREMENLGAEQQAAIETLTLENRRLADTVAGLEQQLAKQQSAVIAAAKPAPPAAAKPAPKASPTPKPAPKPAPAAASSEGNWFVNFSSYGQRAAAESWAGKLKPAAGKVVIAPGSRDGKTFYRVRVINLSDRAQAERVASQLQKAHGLPKLWVGVEE